MFNQAYPKILLLFFIIFNNLIFSQEQLVLGGGFQTNANVFLRDSQIGAANIPQYDYQIFGGESWLDLNASYAGFQGGLRFDLFVNSNLLNPVASYNGYGIGRWYINKKVGNLEITAGHQYDQIGRGIIYRSFEDRTQLIDNALIGIGIKYDLSQDWNIKGFVGRQRNLFSAYQSTLKGVSINGYFQPKEDSKWNISPGIGLVNRTLSDDLVKNMAGVIASYEPDDQIAPCYNSNAFSIFNNLNIKDFNWYIETAFKPNDIYYDPNAIKLLPKGNKTVGKLVKQNASVYYTSLGYVWKTLGITVEGKRTIGMDFRAEPLLSGNRGLINLIPPRARINTFRLIALYYPATQFISEMAYQAEVKYGLGDHWNFTANISNIKDADFKKQFYKEYYLDVVYKHSDKWQLMTGIQRQEYNVELYYGKPGEPFVKTITPFSELLVQFTDKYSLRAEVQYMHNPTNIGSWINVVTEWGMAPHFLFELSDMYNVKPHGGTKKLHYPAVGVSYTKDANRFAIRYVKQIQGIVCSGGICRLEPAFSGFRASVTSSF